MKKSCSNCQHGVATLGDESCGRCKKLDMFEPSDEHLGQLFENKFDCYAETADDSVIMAMTKERFIETVRELLTKGE